MALSITKVSRNSILRKYNIRAGDTILSVNNRDIHNFEGILFESDNDSMLLRIKTEKEIIISILINRDDYVRINTEFLEGKIMSCVNNCMFCFVNQNPKNLRKSLYVKDDDYRLSLSYGNYITLSNLNSSHLKDIIEHHFSPLYVSIHAVNDNIRKKLFGRENSLDKLNELVNNAIHIHAQIVLVKNVNDGEYLFETLAYAKKNKFLSVGIVPCGLTRFREHLPHIESIDRIYAKHIIDSVNAWKKREKAFNIYIADEFYLKADYSVPLNSYYNDFPQIDNGIGMVRDFLNAVKPYKHMNIMENYRIITGKDFGIFLINNGIFSNSVSTITNTFFGETVSVTGLLSGQDIINSLTNINEKHIILFHSIFNDNGITVDNMTIRDIENKTHKKLHIIYEYKDIKEYLNVNN